MLKDVIVINDYLPSTRPQAGGSKQGPGERGVWSGDKSRNVGYGYSENQVTVSMDGDKAAKMEEQRQQKERPIWMTESTVQGAVSEDVTMVMVTYRKTIKFCLHFILENFIVSEKVLK